VSLGRGLFLRQELEDGEGGAEADGVGGVLLVEDLVKDVEGVGGEGAHLLAHGDEGLAAGFGAGLDEGGIAAAPVVDGGAVDAGGLGGGGDGGSRGEGGDDLGLDGVQRRKKRRKCRIVSNVVGHGGVLPARRIAGGVKFSDGTILYFQTVRVLKWVVTGFRVCESVS
jgi:hypothetical protein